MKRITTILTIAITIIISGMVISCGNSQEKQIIEQEQNAGYACPMHPEITSQEQGQCSICGMDLEVME